MTDANTRAIIEGWYHRLGFHPRYDEAFARALDEIEVDPAITAADYDNSEEDGRKNLLYYLYFCEDLAKRYGEKGIPDDILYDTLADIPRWLDTWSELKGGLYLGELGWLSRHFAMNLFKLGRLQFCFNTAKKDYGSHGIGAGDPYLDIHIPASGPLRYEECAESLRMAKDFFGKFYPEYDYKGFMCHSWLLDPTLSRFLPENSNILRFQTLFHIAETEEGDGILQFVLRWRCTRETLCTVEPKSAFAEKVKAAALDGATFYVGQGIIAR